MSSLGNVPSPVLSARAPGNIISDTAIRCWRLHLVLISETPLAREMIRDFFEVAVRGSRNDITTTLGAQSNCSSAHRLARVRSGFAAAISGVLRVKPDGLVFLGPPCGSFVYINRATSKRSRERPYGDESRAYVEEASLTLGCHCAT